MRATLRGVLLGPYALGGRGTAAQEVDAIELEAGAGDVIENGSEAGLQAWIAGFRGRALAAGDFLGQL